MCPKSFSSRIEENAAGEALTVKKAPHRPGTARRTVCALGAMSIDDNADQSSKRMEGLRIRKSFYQFRGIDVLLIGGGTEQQNHTSTALDVRADQLMQTQPLLRRLAFASALSIAALTAAVVIQATLLFPEHFQTLRDPDEARIRRLSLVADGKRAIALLSHTPRVLLHEPQFKLHSCERAENGPFSRGINLGFAPWIVTGARGSELVIVGSLAGDLYSFDPTSTAPQPRIFGKDVEGFSMVLECNRDGSLVVAANIGHISAWNSKAATRLWHRSDIDVVGAHFHATTDRLFCGLVNGPCVELDCHTGATLQTIGAHREAALSLDVSADGAYLATLGSHGRYVVTELATGNELWSKRFPMTGAGPRFSPDGQCVLTAASARAPAVHIFSTTSGEFLAELRGAQAEISGIEVTPGGTVYAWDTTGTLTAWDLATRAMLRQSSVTGPTRIHRGPKLRPGTALLRCPRLARHETCSPANTRSI
jgi:hypothetical protein